MNWRLKNFAQLTTNELYDLLKLRVDVFVVEQTCYYPELDNLDRLKETLHLLVYQEVELIAYLRILPMSASYQDAISIGRVVITNNARGQGLGHQLMKEALDYCQQYFPNQAIKISAQAHLIKFYQQHGFKTISDIYLEDNIPHVGMLKVSDKALSGKL